jgi:hypothetical protein
MLDCTYLDTEAVTLASFITNTLATGNCGIHTPSRKRESLHLQKHTHPKIPAGTVRVSKLGVLVFLWKTHMTSSNLFMNRIQPHETIIRLQGWGLMSIKFIAKGKWHPDTAQRL